MRVKKFLCRYFIQPPLKLAHCLAVSILLRPHTRILSRALIIDSDHILLMRQRWTSAYILPGGHVDSGESIASALERECLEECGVALNPKTLVGVIEQHYKRCIFFKRQNIIFIWKMSDFGLHDTLYTPEYFEKPEWIPLADLSSLDLQPVMLKTWIMQWMHSDSLTFHSVITDSKNNLHS